MGKGWLALGLAAMLLGFAPLFHAACLSAEATAAGYHVMPDGTVMIHDAAEGEAGNILNSAPHGSDSTPAEIIQISLALIVLFVGLLLGRVFSVSTNALFKQDSRSRAGPRPQLARQRYEVDLLVLGVIRI